MRGTSSRVGKTTNWSGAEQRTLRDTIWEGGYKPEDKPRDWNAAKKKWQMGEHNTVGRTIDDVHRKTYTAAFKQYLAEDHGQYLQSKGQATIPGILGPTAPASAPPPPPPVERSQDQRAATFRAWSQIPIMARAGKVAAAAEADSPPAAASAQDPDDISEAVAAEGPTDISEAVTAYLESVKLQHVSALRFINPVYRRSASRPKPVMPVDAPLWIEPPGCTAAASSSTPRGGGGEHVNEPRHHLPRVFVATWEEYDVRRGSCDAAATCPHCGSTDFVVGDGYKWVRVCDQYNMFFALTKVKKCKRTSCSDDGKSSKFFNACDPRTLVKVPRSIRDKIPFVYTPGASVHLSSKVVDELDELVVSCRMSRGAYRSWLSERHHKCRGRVEAAYYHAAKDIAAGLGLSNLKAFGKTDVPRFRMPVIELPSDKTIRAMLMNRANQRGPMSTRRMQLEGPGPTKSLAWDAEYKICKLARVSCGRDRAFRAIYTLMSGDGAVVGQWFSMSDSSKDLKPNLEGVKRRFDSHGFELMLVYTDNCCGGDRVFFGEVWSHLNEDKQRRVKKVSLPPEITIADVTPPPPDCICGPGDACTCPRFIKVDTHALAQTVCHAISDSKPDALGIDIEYTGGSENCT